MSRMETYTGTVSLNLLGIIMPLWHLFLFIVAVYLIYLVITNLQLTKKILKKKCEDEGLIEIMDNSFLVKKEDRK